MDSSKSMVPQSSLDTHEEHKTRGHEHGNETSRRVAGRTATKEGGENNQNALYTCMIFSKTFIIKSYFIIPILRSNFKMCFLCMSSLYKDKYMHRSL